MPGRTLLFIVVAFFTLFGCTTIKTNSSYDSSVDFSKLKTYAWGKNDIQVNRLGRSADSKMVGVEEMARRDIQPIVDIELKAKGFVVDTTGNPDFIVRYIANGSVQQNVPQTYYPGSPPVLTYSSNVGSFMMGAIQIEIKNPSTKKMIWQGYGETPVTGDGSSDAKLTRALKKILRDFPPGK
ncbi:MAG: DUF4136 domain-containing protein [Gammaproteobacteria bacterium]|jgi:hypothetical protein